MLTIFFDKSDENFGNSEEIWKFYTILKKPKKSDNSGKNYIENSHEIYTK